MIIADANVILRWSDGSLSVTGWGWVFFLFLAATLSSSINVRGDR